MSSVGYRLDRALTGVEVSEDGRSSLRVLPEGMLLLSAAGPAPENMTRVVANDREYFVFPQDLEERSSAVVMDLRKPMAAAAAGSVGEGTSCWRWAM